jgi:hypothetical protein
MGRTSLNIYSMLREYAARRGWTIVSQIKEVGSGAAERELREKLLAAARRRESMLCWSRGWTAGAGHSSTWSSP